MATTIHTIAARLGLRLERAPRGWVLVEPAIDLRDWHANLGHVAQRIVRAGGSSTVELTEAEAAELARVAAARGVPCPVGVR